MKYPNFQYFIQKALSFCRTRAVLFWESLLWCDEKECGVGLHD